MGHYRGRGETAGLQHKDTFKEADLGSYRGAIIQDSILPPPTEPSVDPKFLASKKKKKKTPFSAAPQWVLSDLQRRKGAEELERQAAARN